MPDLIGQLKRGDTYDRLCPVFLVGLLNFKLVHEDESEVLSLTAD